MTNEQLLNMQARLKSMLAYCKDYPQEDLYLEGQVAAMLELVNYIVQGVFGD